MTPEEVRDAHDAGEHNDPDSGEFMDCDACFDERPDLNREGDPAFNGAFDKW